MVAHHASRAFFSSCLTGDEQSQMLCSTEALLWVSQSQEAAVQLLFHSPSCPQPHSSNATLARDLTWWFDQLEKVETVLKWKAQLFLLCICSRVTSVLWKVRAFKMKLKKLKTQAVKITSPSSFYSLQKILPWLLPGVEKIVLNHSLRKYTSITN